MEKIFFDASKDSIAESVGLSHARGEELNELILKVMEGERGNNFDGALIMEKFLAFALTPEEGIYLALKAGHVCQRHSDMRDLYTTEELIDIVTGVVEKATGKRVVAINEDGLSDGAFDLLKKLIGIGSDKASSDHAPKRRGETGIKMSSDDED